MCWLAVLCAGHTTLGQVAPGPAPGGAEDPIPKLLRELKETEPYQRSDKRAQLVKIGPAAVEPLADVLKAFRQEQDANFITHCALALGEIQAVDRAQRRAATDALMVALRAPSSQVQYGAAVALQGLWSEDAASDMEALRVVNAALAASLLEAQPSPSAYGPGLALLRINSPGNSSSVTLTSLTPEELRDEAEAWVADHPDLLPPLADQPWELLLAKVRRDTDPEGRQQAKAILVREKPLAAVDTLARYLKSGKLSTQLWADMADVLTGITGRQFPRTPPAENPGALVDQWMKDQEEYLKGQKGDAYRRYSWQRFERAVARANEDPTQENLQQVERLRTILLHQLDAPADFPQGASVMATGLIEKMLAAKAVFAQALKDLQQATASEQQIVYIGKMQQVTDGEGGKAISRQFLDAVVACTRKQERPLILASLARLLTTITGVPLLFGQDVTAKDVNNIIDQWLEKVRQSEKAEAAGVK